MMRIVWFLALFGACACIRPAPFATEAVKLTDEELKQSLEPEATLALIVPKSSTTTAAGTRSQRTIYQLEILRVIHQEPPVVELPGRVEGTHYGKALMKKGSKYVAVLQSVPAWRPALWVPAMIEVPDARVDAELQEYAERIRSLRAGH